jgi:hypothetical protein
MPSRYAVLLDIVEIGIYWNDDMVEVPSGIPGACVE